MVDNAVDTKYFNKPILILLSQQNKSTNFLSPSALSVLSFRLPVIPWAPVLPNRNIIIPYIQENWSMVMHIPILSLTFVFGDDL